MGLCTQCLLNYLRGICDSLRGFLVFYALDSDVSDSLKKSGEKRHKMLAQSKTTTVLQRRRLSAAERNSAQKRNVEQQPILKPRALNGLSALVALNITAILLLHFVTSRLPSAVGRAVHGFVSCIFFIVAKILSSIWFTDIANACLKYRGIQTPYLSVSRTAKDFLSAVLLDLMLLLQTGLVGYVPVPFIAALLYFLHTALLNALFSFEYIWMSLGFGFKIRVARIEQNVPYFLGFGTVLSLLTNLFDSVLLNGLLFGAFFPFFIVSTYMADKECYERPAGLSMHLFAPSVAATSYCTGTLSLALKSWSRRTRSSEKVKREVPSPSGITPREHRSQSPSLPHLHAVAGRRQRHASRHQCSQEAS